MQSVSVSVHLSNIFRDVSVFGSVLSDIESYTVKYSNRNNLVVECSTVIKFYTEFHNITDNTLWRFKDKGEGHG